VSAPDVLVVEDEPTIAELVGRYLVRAGYTARTAADGLEALAAVEQRRPDLVVLDVMLPRLDGLAVLQQLRERDGPTPGVILLTARGSEQDRIAGLRLGADDYVAKPFSVGELIARVDAVLRRTAPAAATTGPLRFGDLVVAPASRRVWRGEEEIALTQREFDLLAFLAEHPGQVFSREQLMDAVWRFPFYTDTSTVTVHVRRLRAKLEADPARPERLQTVWGVGYRFAP
jgi:DNA-binding response OmpR family regulator